TGVRTGRVDAQRLSPASLAQASWRLARKSLSEGVAPPPPIDASSEPEAGEGIRQVGHAVRESVPASRPFVHGVRVAIPSTPFFAESAVVSIRLRSEVELPVVRQSPLASSFSPPEWPPAPLAGRATVESTLIDDHPLRRSRSPAERLVWTLALGAVPLWTLGAGARRLAAGRGRLRGSIIWMVAAGLATALYAGTPVGSALGRVLAGF
ncbi:MAG TPA: hypothetical protein VNC50_05715, partial [Planctomycetia bacterium]|nr:hypothetical protein [Planctomycetia bacterium]